MVQRCIDAVAGTDAELAILPAATANLLAANLRVPAIWPTRCATRPARGMRPLDAGRRTASTSRLWPAPDSTPG